MARFTREEFERACKLVGFAILLMQLDSRWKSRKGTFTTSNMVRGNALVIIPYDAK